ncbi:MAG TPA: TauD/TfdA family dioxygenase [Ramlibacter sp.]|nr:TauD/TfdA family dioxygenase [Ramlibacter sp.]
MKVAQLEPVGVANTTEILPTVTPETGTCGASVFGLNLRVSEHSPAVQQLLVRALHEHGVLFFRFEGDIDTEDHKRIARIFGDLHESYFNRGADPLVSILDNEKTGSPKYGTDQWHTDVSVVDKPPLAASLRAIKLPKIGGDTMWASMYVAYETLSSKMQRLLDGLEAVHSTETLLRARPAAREVNLFGQSKSAIHPVVIRDPVTGRPALYVNSGYTERIVGMSLRESNTILQMLFDHVNTPDFHVRLKWDTRTIVVWEERVTQHRAIDDYTGHRVLHRIVINGEAPQAYGHIVRGAEDALNA